MFGFQRPQNLRCSRGVARGQGTQRDQVQSPGGVITLFGHVFQARARIATGGQVIGSQSQDGGTNQIGLGLGFRREVGQPFLILAVGASHFRSRQGAQLKGGWAVFIPQKFKGKIGPAGLELPRCRQKFGTGKAVDGHGVAPRFKQTKVGHPAAPGCAFGIARGFHNVGQSVAITQPQIGGRQQKSRAVALGHRRGPCDIDLFELPDRPVKVTRGPEVDCAPQMERRRLGRQCRRNQ